ncbi:MAG: hypothetical protein DWQ00_07010 [Candidatus Scalindua sp.]|nr:MAG: hypothetical protein DWQ00_07010 [Candidatus Scalindua sp.]
MNNSYSKIEKEYFCFRYDKRLKNFEIEVLEVQEKITCVYSSELYLVYSGWHLELVLAITHNMLNMAITRKIFF